MAVTALHREYEKRLADWQTMRDVLDGERLVKDAGITYLPKPAGQEVGDYSAYKKRAPYEAATARTLQGMLGLLFRHPPESHLPEAPAAEALLGDVTHTGLPLAFFARHMADEYLATGRFGIIVDRATVATGRSFLRGYAGEAIRNWRWETTEDGARRLRLVVLEEYSEVVDSDGYGAVLLRQMRVLKLDEADRYVVELWRPSSVEQQGDNDPWVLADTLRPTFRGAPLDFIPFELVGDDDGAGDTVCPPLLAIANLNLCHYRTGADLHHALHMVALPTPWVADDHHPDSAGKPASYFIGSGTAWLLGPGGSAGMLEVSGAGIGSLREELSRLERRMAALGGRMLESQQKDVEASDTLRLRQTGENSVLMNIADRLSINLSRAVRWALWWDGLVGDRADPEVKVSINTDFFDQPLAATDIGQLVAGWQMGAYPWEVLAWNLRQGERIPPTMSDDDMRKLLAVEGRSRVENAPFDDADETPDDDAEA